MSGEKPTKRTVPDLLKQLWNNGFFFDEKDFQSIKLKLSSLGCNPSSPSLQMAIKRAKYLTQRGRRGNYYYIQKFASKEVCLTSDILPEDLIKALGKDFEMDINDLRLNFGKSGTCTAFLLRKILEKMIFLAFAKNSQTDKLQDKSGNFVSLKTMLDLATSCKISGKPFLMPKTAKEIQGIKFLGDTSAHNPLINVSMRTILPVMPFIVTAYLELSKKL
jgi:hypothetical protein